MVKPVAIDNENFISIWKEEGDEKDNLYILTIRDLSFHLTEEELKSLIKIFSKLNIDR